MNASNNILLKVEGLKKYFPVRRGFFQKVAGWIKAVDGVDLVIHQGKTLGLVGESGCGKSTTGRLILKLLEPDSGKIIYKNQDITSLPQDSMKPLRKDIQIIFQDPYGSLNPRMTVGQSIEEGLRTLGVKGHVERNKKIGQLLELVGIGPGSADRYPHEFSGGQRQRIGIARALSVEPSLIVCDEPVSALDVSIQAQIINLLTELQHRLALTYLFISHDLSVIEYLSDMVAVMYLGRIVEKGTTAEVFDNTKHPYTKALLSAVPNIDLKNGIEKMHLKGDVPSPFNPPQGCHFHPRCSYMIPHRCELLYPGLSHFSDTHSCHCYLYPQ
jgi:oligopeptide/dipeptide ABC transporter ATP-binding protein